MVSANQGIKLMMPDDKKELVERILAVELTMFLNVRTSGRAACQEHPEEFRRNRTAQFFTWSEKTLMSYLDDLMSAQEEGNNLMTLKYARMGNQIPRLNDDPLIEKIVVRQTVWQKDLAARYPFLMGRARVIESRQDTDWQTSFETYLRGELETYSGKTLRSLYEDLQRYEQDHQNMNQRLYEFLVRDLGYGSLDEAEKAAGSNF
jgi:hypothetical protein